MRLSHLQLFLLLSVGVLAVRGAPAPGLTVHKQTVRCCGEVKIQINKDCLNRFSIGETAKAEVNGAEVLALEPFKSTADGMMLVQDCVNFTHQVHCDVGETGQTEERFKYQLIPCYAAPRTAAVPLGSDL